MQYNSTFNKFVIVMKKAVDGYVIKHDETLLKDIGSAIYSYRKSEGLTQESLGALLNMDKSQVSKMESGSNLTVSTIGKVFDSMGAEVMVHIRPKPHEAADNCRDDLISTIFEFSRRHGITPRQAYNYLERFGGIDFYLQDPGLEKELPINDTLESLASICRKNGGRI